jgi:type III pantothenate kinase
LISGLMGLKGHPPREIDAAIMCSVVPPVTDLVRTAIAMICDVEPLVVGTGVRTGIRVNYDRTQDVGTDRVVDAVAAHQIYGGPVIVIDIGTGLVFNAITAEGEYIGGAIAPGLRIAAEAMYQRTSMLRRIELVAPPAAIGRSTVASMQSGVIYGYAELVEGMVRRFKKEMAPDAPDSCKVIATGGLSSVLTPHVTCIDHVDIDLTLKGLRLVHEMNCR